MLRLEEPLIPAHGPPPVPEGEVLPVPTMLAAESVEFCATVPLATLTDRTNRLKSGAEADGLPHELPAMETERDCETRLICPAAGRAARAHKQSTRATRDGRFMMRFPFFPQECLAPHTASLLDARPAKYAARKSKMAWSRCSGN